MRRLRRYLSPLLLLALANCATVGDTDQASMSLSLVETNINAAFEVASLYLSDPGNEKLAEFDEVYRAVRPIIRANLLFLLDFYGSDPPGDVLLAARNYEALESIHAMSARTPSE